MEWRLTNCSCTIVNFYAKAIGKLKQEKVIKKILDTYYLYWFTVVCLPQLPFRQLQLHFYIRRDKQKNMFSCQCHKWEKISLYHSCKWCCTRGESRVALSFENPIQQSHPSGIRSALKYPFLQINKLNLNLTDEFYTIRL